MEECIQYTWQIIPFLIRLPKEKAFLHKIWFKIQNYRALHDTQVKKQDLTKMREKICTMWPQFNKMKTREQIQYNMATI